MCKLNMSGNVCLSVCLSVCGWSDDLWTPEEENQGEPEWLTQERAHFSQHRDKNGDGKLDKVS